MPVLCGRVAILLLENILVDYRFGNVNRERVINGCCTLCSFSCILGKISPVLTVDRVVGYP